MKPIYVVFFNYFKNGGPVVRYTFFESKERLDRFLKYNPVIKERCIIFKKVDIKEEK